jgi:hypothetical protein
MPKRFIHLPRATVAWLQNNPIKAFLATVFGTIGLPALINTLLQEVFVPALLPLNIITNVSTLKPSLRSTFTLGETKSYSPLELEVSVKNPGKKKIFLMRSVWTAEVCKLAPKSSSPSSGGAAQESTDDLFFASDLQANNNPWKSKFPTTFLGFEPQCRFIGIGNLVADSSVSPGEEISTRILIVYPAAISFYQGGPMQQPDYIRINTIIPSSSTRNDNLSYRLQLKKEDLSVSSADSSPANTPRIRAPRGFELWLKRDKGRLNDDCVFDTRKMAKDERESFRPLDNQVVVSSETVQVWCKLSLEEERKKGIISSQSSHETWLTERSVDK